MAIAGNAGRLPDYDDHIYKNKYIDFFQQIECCADDEAEKQYNSLKLDRIIVFSVTPTINQEKRAYSSIIDSQQDISLEVKRSFKRKANSIRFKSRKNKQYNIKIQHHDTVCGVYHYCYIGQLGKKRRVSIKPQNIIVNYHKMIDLIPSTIIMGHDIVNSVPVVKYCAVFLLVKELLNLFSVEIKKEMIYILSTAWKNCDQKQSISVDKCFSIVNQALERNNEEKLSYTEFNYILDSMVKLKSIEILEDIIFLKESVCKSI